MTVYAVYQTATGALVSVGTVVANPLPAGLTALALSVADAQGLRDGSKTWDAATLTCVAVPVDPAVTNEATLRTDPQTQIDVLVAAIAALQAIVDLPNATINGNPAASLKNVAREAMTIGRRTVRLARLELGVLSSTDGT